MRRVRAYAFSAEKSLPELRDAFNALGPWRWLDRDSDRHGDYISTRVMPDGMVKVFVDGDRFVVNLVVEAPPAKLDAVHQTLTRLLQSVSAVDLAETEPIE